LYSEISKTRFGSTIFKFLYEKKLVSVIEGVEGNGEVLDWNPKLSSNGDTRSKRRMRVGSRGEQKEIIQIVSKNDVTT